MGEIEVDQDVRARLLQDTALQQLMSRMPAKVQERFSEEQLSYLKMALGARSWGSHMIDWRGTMKFLRHRYYVVFLLGRNRRKLTRGEQKIGFLMQAIFLTGFLVFSILLGLLGLYLAKSAAGINLIPGFSFGIWSWFKS